MQSCTFSAYYEFYLRGCLIITGDPTCPLVMWDEEGIDGGCGAGPLQLLGGAREGEDVDSAKVDAALEAAPAAMDGDDATVVLGESCWEEEMEEVESLEQGSKGVTKSSPLDDMGPPPPLRFFMIPLWCSAIFRLVW